MSALRVILVLVVLYAGARISCHAKILSYDQLNLNEKMALEDEASGAWRFTTTP